MRILHVIDSLNPAEGGPATVIARLAAAQAALGHMVTVFSHLAANEQEVVNKNIGTIPGIERVKLEFVRGVTGWDWVRVTTARPALRRQVGDASIVHLHGVWAPLLHVASQFAREMGVPYVVRPAGMLDPWSLRQRWLKKRTAMWLGGYRKMFNGCAFMHTLNVDEKRLIGKLRLRCALEVIPNGIFEEEVANLPAPGTFRAAHRELKDAPYILFLSRLHYKKGLDHLAESFTLAAKERPDLHLVVAGPDGGARGDFLARVQRAGVAERAHVVGPLYGRDKLAALVDATVFCLPSRQEGFSLAITEALACGLPAVVSEDCHFPEVQEAGAGRVVALEPRGLARALLEVVGDEGLRAQMGRNGARLVHERFTWPRIAQQTIEAYERAFDRLPPRAMPRDPKRLKILHVISSLAVEAGGPPVICAGIAEAQARLGHDVTIAAAGLMGKLRVKISEQVKVVEYPITGLARYASSPELEQWLVENMGQVDFVHLHSVWQQPTYVGAREAWRHQTPYVVMLNGMLEAYSVRHRSYLIKRAYWWWRESKIFRGASGLHCGSASEIRKAIDWIASSPKFIVGNAISESDLLAIPERGRFRAAWPEVGERPMALFMSRLHPKKGLDCLLPVWKTVVDKHPDSILVVAGAGPTEYEQLIDRQIEEFGLSKHVKRVGQLAGSKKWEALADADLFVLPSHQEGFSMAITEALGARCAVVATESCNYEELATHNCGIEIPHDDMVGFVEAVNALLDDPARRQKLGQNGRALIESRYTWERVAEDLLKVYRWIIQGRPLPRDGASVWREPVGQARAAATAAERASLLSAK